MKARTIGPILMMTLGGALMIAPALTTVNAAVVTTCDTVVNIGGNTSPCNPCDTLPAGGVQATCDSVPTTDNSGSGSGIPKTGSNDWGYLVLGAAFVAGGGALLVTARRSPKPTPST